MCGRLISCICVFVCWPEQFLVTEYLQHEVPVVGNCTVHFLLSHHWLLPAVNCHCWTTRFVIVHPVKQCVKQACFFAVGSAVDTDKCAWGESYWCSDLQAAKTCGAFRHCMGTVWKNQKLVQVTHWILVNLGSVLSHSHHWKPGEMSADDWVNRLSMILYFDSTALIYHGHSCTLCYCHLFLLNL